MCTREPETLEQFPLFSEMAVLFSPIKASAAAPPDAEPAGLRCARKDVFEEQLSREARGRGCGGGGGGGELQAKAAKQGGEGRGSEWMGCPLRGPGHQRFSFWTQPKLGGKRGDGDGQIHCLRSYVKHMISIPQIVPHPLPQVPCICCILAIKIQFVQKEISGVGRNEGYRRAGSVSQASMAIKAEVAQL